MANKLVFDTKGLEEMIAWLSEFDNGTEERRAVEDALKDSKDYVTKQLAEEIERHRRTGITEKSLDKNDSVSWEGTQASIPVGFHIRQGGLASIFLMYGTPRMQPDKKLYNAIYGSKTKKEIHEIQEAAFIRAINRAQKKRR